MIDPCSAGTGHGGAWSRLQLPTSLKHFLNSMMSVKFAEVLLPSPSHHRVRSDSSPLLILPRRLDSPIDLPSTSTDRLVQKMLVAVGRKGCKVLCVLQ